MRQEVLEQFRDLENKEEKLTQLAKSRYGSLKTRDIPWEIYLALMRGVVNNILQTFFYSVLITHHSLLSK